MIYDLKTQNLLKRIILPYPWVYALEFSPDGNILAVICKFYIIIYKLPDFMEVMRFQGSCGDDDKQTLAFSPNGDYLAVGCKQKILVFDVDNKFNEIKNINFSQESVLSVKYSPDGTTLSCGGEDKYINLYDAKNNY